MFDLKKMRLAQALSDSYYILLYAIPDAFTKRYQFA